VQSHPLRCLVQSQSTLSAWTLDNIWSYRGIPHIVYGLLMITQSLDHCPKPNLFPSIFCFFPAWKIQPFACHNVLQDETLQMAPAPPAEFSTEDRMLHETLEDFYWRNRQKKTGRRMGCFLFGEEWENHMGMNWT
jgi:hypothetical protein